MLPIADPQSMPLIPIMSHNGPPQENLNSLFQNSKSRPLPLIRSPKVNLRLSILSHKLKAKIRSALRIQPLLLSHDLVKAIIANAHARSKTRVAFGGAQDTDVAVVKHGTL